MSVGVVLKELAGALFLIAYVLCAGPGILGVSIRLNALHSCSLYCLVAVCASARKFHSTGWFTWDGFISIFIAVFIVVIAVTTLDRPAAAPQTGDYELG